MSATKTPSRAVVLHQTRFSLIDTIRLPQVNHFSLQPLAFSIALLNGAAEDVEHFFAGVRILANQSSGRSPLGDIFTKGYFTGGSGVSVPEDCGGELVDVPGFTAGTVSAPASSSGRMVMAMRRFLALPSAVALSARGRYSP